MTQKYTLEEQETFIHLSPIDHEIIYETSYQPHIKNILALHEASPDAFKSVETETNDEGLVISVIAIAANSKQYPMPINRFKRFLPRKKRDISPAQLESLKRLLNKNHSQN